MDEFADQTWLPVVGFEGRYEVSDQGLIRSLRYRHKKLSVVLKTPLDSRGYQQLNLGRGGHTFVHLVVATAFHGPKPPGLTCRHLDGNKLNNRADNLAWGTYSENNLDLVRHGTHYTKFRDATHCVNGHEFTPENTGQRSDHPGRFCIACKKRRNKEQAARRKAARWAKAGITS